MRALSAILSTVRMCEYLTIYKPSACSSHLSAYQSSWQARLLEKVDECTTHNPPRTRADDWKGEIEGRRTHVYNIHHIIRYDKVWRNRNLRAASIARRIQKHRPNTQKERGFTGDISTWRWVQISRALSVTPTNTHTRAKFYPNFLR
jgi:hypothetical protein